MSTTRWTFKPPFVLFLFSIFGLSFAVESATAAEPATNSPVKAKVGAYVLNVADFDLTGKTFSSELWLWSNGGPKEESPIKYIEFIGAKNVSLTLTQTETNESGTYCATKATGVFRHNWDTHNFPFDRHTLTIAFESSKDDRDSLVFVPQEEKSGLHSEIQLDGWKITGFQIKEAAAEYKTDFGDPKTTEPSATFSRVTLSLRIARSGYLAFFKVASGVYFAALLALLSFFLQTSQMSLMSPRMSILGASLFAALVNLRSAESVLGRTEVLTLVDKIHIATMIYIAGAAIVTIISRRQCDAEKPASARKLDFAAFWIFLVSFLALNAALVVNAWIQG